MTSFPRFGVWILTLGWAVPSHAATPKPWTYAIVYEAKTKVLTVTADLPSGTSLTGDPLGFPFVEGLKKLGPEPRDLGAPKSGLTLPACLGSCQIHYTFALGKASETLGESDSIRAVGEVILSNPSLWLLRPSTIPPTQPIELTMTVEGDSRSQKNFIATGLFPLPKDPNTYGTTADHLADMPWTLVGPFRAQSFTVKGATIDLAILPAAYSVKDADILAWCQRATRALVAFYGAFPVPHALVIVVPRDSYKGPGKSFGDGGAVTINPLGLKADNEALKRDWVMTHEMVHLAFPSVAFRQHWVEEGLATYVEPLARIRSGELSPASVFADMVRDMPQGLPKKGDGGLDGPSSWSKTYWGGALFALLADKEFRVRSKGRVGLDDALRGIIKAGGTMAVSWNFRDALEAGDKAAGYPVLMELYNKMKDDSAPMDLSALWASLGVETNPDGTVRFNDRASLAFVRKGMTSANP